MAAQTVPFARATKLAGIELTIKRVERSAEADGASAARAASAQADAISARKLVPLPPPPRRPRTCSTSPLTAPASRSWPAKPRAGAGKARTSEVKLACLFTQISLNDDGHPVRDHASTTYLATFEPADRFGVLLQAEGIRRRAEHIRRLVGRGDGAAWIWNLAGRLYPATTEIVDLYHAREHPHDLADLGRT